MGLITGKVGLENVKDADLIIEAVFDDLAGLQAYLEHPQHEKLGALFYQALEAALVYDYDLKKIG